jgi:hypothetical protein
MCCEPCKTILSLGISLTWVSVLQRYHIILNFIAMKKPQPKVKAKKKRADKYDTKLTINGTFEDVIKVSVIPMRELKEEKNHNKK